MFHVQKSHVVVYAIEFFSTFRVDDFKLIKQVVDQERPVVIAVNKW